MYQGDIEIIYTKPRLTVCFKENIETLRIINNKLVLDYKLAYFDSTWLNAEHENNPDSLDKLSEEDKDILNKLAEELNVSCY